MDHTLWPTPYAAHTLWLTTCAPLARPLFPEPGDIFQDNYGTAGAAKRSLYITLVHSQVAVDVLTEEDLADGSLNSYSVLYLCR